MRSRSKTPKAIAAQDLSKESPDEACFEVDDIASLEATSPTLSKPDSASTLSKKPTPEDAMSLEIELSADDMNALLDGLP